MLRSSEARPCVAEAGMPHAERVAKDVFEAMMEAASYPPTSDATSERA